MILDEPSSVIRQSKLNYFLEARPTNATVHSCSEFIYCRRESIVLLADDTIAERAGETHVGEEGEEQRTKSDVGESGGEQRDTRVSRAQRLLRPTRLPFIDSVLREKGRQINIQDTEIRRREETVKATVSSRARPTSFSKLYSQQRKSVSQAERIVASYRN
ncbi:hypothetical protein ALC53_05528 [Atta colombica]|uniref:Uncharacterized protein n=1 Tax=Atta colombica TaxID=520822 RepID=A0A195BHB8_9HYME|nr:hypothetical protein ALC53_05528 [Atta colombica]